MSILNTSSRQGTGNRRLTVSGWARLLGASLVLSLSAALCGCSPGNVFGAETVIVVGNLSAQPAELTYARDATVLTADRRVLVLVPRRLKNPGVDATIDCVGYLTLSVSGLPRGVQASLVDSRVCVDNSGDGATHTFAFDLQVVSSVALGRVSPGRHVVTLQAELCEIVDPNCDVNTTPLLIIIEGAAAPGGLNDLVAVPQLTSVRLSWAADAAPDSYLIERARTGAAFITVATLPAPATQYTDTGLDPATAYTYRVTPQNAAGSGPAGLVDTLTLATSNGTLAVQSTGTGSGTVSSAPAGIVCPGTCGLTAPLGSIITLTATPAVGSRFDGWEGPADCADGSITMVLEIACTARFVAAPAASGWRQIGGDLAVSGGSAPRLAVDGNGVVYAAFLQDSLGKKELLVRRYDGSIWQPVGTGSVNAATGGGGARSFGLAFDAANRPLVAWDDFSVVRVARLEGATWQLLADNLRNATTGVASNVQLEARGSTAVVAWIDAPAGTSRLAVRRYDGALWSADTAPDVGDLLALRLALDSHGLAGIAYAPNLSPSQPSLRAVRETSFGNWTALPGSADSNVGTSNTHLRTGFGFSFSINDAPIISGSRDDRYSFALVNNSVSWVAAGRVNQLVDPAGVVEDTGNSTEFLRGLTSLTSETQVVLASPRAAGNPTRIQFYVLDGNDWIAFREPLRVTGVSSAPSAAFDAMSNPLVVTVQSSTGALVGAIRAYAWAP